MGLSAALVALLELDGRPPRAEDDAAALLKRVQGSPWLRFAVGVNPDEPVPHDPQGVERAALEFAQAWKLWLAYRTCVIEVSPPGAAAVRFAIDPAVGGAPPVEFPAATFAVITAWNPGSGEPRPNERANRRANQQLAAHLDARLLERWPAVNAPGSRWREESFAVLGIELDEAHRIAEAFQQRALYYVDRGRPLLVARRRGRVVTWEGELRVLA
jgi:hypothetical protein